MKKTRFTESQIIKALKENEQGRSVSDISRELGIDKSTFYYWYKKYGGMKTSHLKRLKELEAGLFYVPFELHFENQKTNAMHL